MCAQWKGPALVALAVLVAAPAMAQEKTDPEEITTGVVRLTLNKAYASATVDGELSEDGFFEDDGRVLVLEGLARKTPHVLHLVPMEEEFRFEDVTIDPKDWKLARLDKETRQWQFHRTVTFRAWKPGEREEWEKTRAPASEEEEEPGEETVPAAKPGRVLETPEPETAPMAEPVPPEEPAAPAEEPTAPAEEPAAPAEEPAAE